MAARAGAGALRTGVRENEVVADILPKLTADDLKDMGVTIVGHRRKLLEARKSSRSPLHPSPARPAIAPGVVVSGDHHDREFDAESAHRVVARREGCSLKRARGRPGRV